MRACFESLQGHGRVVLGIGADRNSVWAQRRERLVQPFETRQLGKLGSKVVPFRRAGGAKADELKALDCLIGTGVARSHRTEANHENADAFRA
jgi:hypothetical protein